MWFRYRAILPAFAATIALSAVLAATAAAHEWQWGTALPGGWGQSGVLVPEATATTSTGKLLVSDEGLELRVECEVGTEGSVGSGLVDKDTSVTLAKCAPRPGNCESVHKAEAVGLPWSSKLSGSAGSLRDGFSSEGKKTGFKFQCETTLGLVTDECTAESITSLVRNVTGGVETSFGTYSGEDVLNCSVGGKNEGRLSGGRTIAATKGSKLEVINSGGSFKKLTGNLSVKSTGELKLVDSGGRAMSVACQIETEGTIGAAGKGSVTSFVAHNCKGSGGCGTVGSITAVNLPWNTELYGAESLAREKIVSGGKGTPEWSFECEKVADTCYLSSPSLEDSVTGGVVASFSESLGRVHCSDDYLENEAAWSGSLVFSPPSGVQAIGVKWE